MFEPAPNALRRARNQPVLWGTLRYGCAVAAVMVGFELHQALAAWVGAALPPFILFYPTVVVAALLAGLGPGLVATGLTLIVVNLWMMPPIGQWSIAAPVDRLALALFAFNGLLICAVGELYRRNREKVADYERKAALSTSEERLRLATQAAKLGAFDWDVQTGVNVWTPELEAMYGLAPGEFGRTQPAWEQLVHPDDRAAIVALNQQTLETGEPVEGEWRVVWPDGSVHWVAGRFKGFKDAAGKPARLTGVNMDITERKQVEEALRRSAEELQAANARLVDSRRAAMNLMEEAVAACEQTERGREELQLILDSSPALIFYKDLENRFWRVNRAFAEIMGLPKEQLEGRSLFDLHSRDEAEAYWKDDLEVIATGKPKLGIVEPIRAGERWLQTDKVPCFGGKGEIIGVIGFATDITARKQAEEALRALLVEKEVLLKEIHHRVKNNMQVLSSLVNLQANSMTDPAVLAALADVRDRVRSMGLVHEKLYQSTNLAAVDFAGYAESLLQALWHANRSVAAVELKLALQPVSLTVEKAVPCGMILNELASNTFKHAFLGRARGVVTVSTCTQADGRVSLCVSDDGVGLPEGFDWRQAPSLGLKLVQMLTKQLDGAVEARRSDAGGTEFQIQFAARSGGET